MGYDYYITPEEYERAASYGVDGFTLERRVRLLGWKKERAITTPIRKITNRKHWVKIAEANGIKYHTFMTRVNTWGWDMERAATEPIQDRCKAALLAVMGE